MWKSSESARTRIDIVLAWLCRTISVSLVAFQAAMHLSDVFNPVLVVPACLAVSVTGAATALTRLRTIPAVSLSVILPFLVKLAGSALLSLAAGTLPNPGMDTLVAEFDSWFVPFWPMASWAVLSSFCFLRFPFARRMEPLLNTALFAAAFASQSGFKASMYPHPLVIAAFAALFLATVTTSLFFSARNGSRGKRRGPWSLAASALPLAIVLLLFLLGRYSDAAVRSGGGLIKPTLFRFDFQDVLGLESEISLGNDLVLLVRKNPESQSYLMRRYVLSGYERKKGFFREPVAGVPEPAEAVPASRTAWPAGQWKERETLEQEYYVVDFDTSVFVAMNEPVEAVPFEVPPDSGFQSVYRVTSRVASASNTLCLTSESGFPEPDDVSPPSYGMTAEAYGKLTDWAGDIRIRDLAHEITRDMDGYYDRVNAICQYLKTGYLYSLKPGMDPDGDQLGRFLFTAKKGYCSYFAFSMALLLRSIGIPSRVAVGFFLSPDDETIGVYPVRSSMAHAWTEVWFPGYGWIEFDPTSDTPAPGEDMSPAKDRDPLKFMRLLEELLSRRGSLRESTARPQKAFRQENPGSFSLSSALSGAVAAWPFLLAFAYLAALAATHGYPFLRSRIAPTPRERVIRRFASARAFATSVLRAADGPETGKEWSDRMGTVLGPAAGEAERLWERSEWDREFGADDESAYREAERLLVREAVRKAGRFAVFRAVFFPWSLEGAKR